MFEQFSRAYYLGRLYVEPRDDAVARMCQDQHRRVAEQLYETDDEPAPGDRPLVMKLGTRHFPVHGETDVPADTLSVPPTVLDDTDVTNPPSLREVLLATADRAAQLLRLTAGSVDENATPTDVERASESGWGSDPGSGTDGTPFDRDGPDGPAGI